MSDSILISLRLHRYRLRALRHLNHTFSETQELKDILALTIQDLHALYPDELSSPQRHQLLQNLTLLEHQQQFIRASPRFLDDPLSWQSVQQALLITIDNTLEHEDETKR